MLVHFYGSLNVPAKSFVLKAFPKHHRPTYGLNVTFYVLKCIICLLVHLMLCIICIKAKMWFVGPHYMLPLSYCTHSGISGTLKTCNFMCLCEQWLLVNGWLQISIKYGSHHNVLFQKDWNGHLLTVCRKSCQVWWFDSEGAKIISGASHFFFSSSAIFHGHSCHTTIWDILNSPLQNINKSTVLATYFMALLFDASIWPCMLYYYLRHIEKSTVKH